MIGAPKEIDIDTSETSSYKSSQGKEKPQAEEKADIKELQAEINEIEEEKEETAPVKKPAEEPKED